MKKIDRDWIDNASYEELLRVWRFVPLGEHPFDDLELAKYFEETMTEKKTHEERVAASKRIGWGK